MWSAKSGRAGRSGSPLVVITALGSCGIAVALMHTLVIPLLPVFPTLLDVSRAEVSWLVTATMLTGAVSAPVFGRLGDLFGKRRILLVVLGIMFAGSVLGAVSWSYVSLMIARPLQGAAFGVIPLGMSLLKEMLPAKQAGSGVATMSSTLGAGGAIGLPLAGFLGSPTGTRCSGWPPQYRSSPWDWCGYSCRSPPCVLPADSISPARSGCPPPWSACCSAYLKVACGDGTADGPSGYSWHRRYSLPSGRRTNCGWRPLW